MTTNNKESIMKAFIEALPEFIMKFFGEVKSEPATETVKDQMISYEVVYEPNELDAHGQWMSADTLEKACENFNQNLKAGVVSPNLFHMKNTDSFEICDTWIQKEMDVVVEQTGEKIKAGTWVAKLQYKNEHLWNLKKAGVIQGVSIGGTGTINSDTGEITNVSFDNKEEA